MIFGVLARKVFKLTGKTKVLAEIVVAAVEIGLLVTFGWVTYPVEAIAVKAITYTT